MGGWPRQFVVAGWNTIIGKRTLCQSEVEFVFVTIFAPFANQEQMCGNIVTDDEEVRDGLTGRRISSVDGVNSVNDLNYVDEETFRNAIKGRTTYGVSRFSFPPLHVAEERTMLD